MADHGMAEYVHGDHIPLKPSDVMLDAIRDRLAYDAETGLILWKTTTNKTKAGEVAGTVTKRGAIHIYLTVNKKGKKLAGHHVAWFLHYGVWPDQQIDHHDGFPGNNKIGNLRLATNGQNPCNSRVQRNSKTGITGVFWNKRVAKFQAFIVKNNRQIHLGFFSDLEAARAARVAAEIIYHGEFAASARAGAPEIIYGPDHPIWQRKTTTGVRGVYWCAQDQKYHADIQVNGRRYRYGRFDTLEEAASVRREAEAAETPATPPKRPKLNKSTGTPGVSWCKRREKFEVYIQVDGKRRNLVRYATLEEARKVRLRAEREHQGA